MRNHVVTTGRVWSRGAFMLVLGYFMCVNVKSTESSGGDYKGILTYYYLEWEFLTEQKFYSELSIFKALKKSSIKWMKPGRNERKISEWIFCIKFIWDLNDSHPGYLVLLHTCLYLGILLLSCSFIINPLNWTKTDKNFRPLSTWTSWAIFQSSELTGGIWTYYNLEIFLHLSTQIFL